MSEDGVSGRAVGCCEVKRYGGGKASVRTRNRWQQGGQGPLGGGIAQGRHPWEGRPRGGRCGPAAGGGGGRRGARSPELAGKGGAGGWGGVFAELQVVLPSPRRD